MSHVDEGTLHAYLDDRERGPAAGALTDELRARVTAHLAECDVCSAELRRAERQRARASDILLAATPTIETPPFEAVQPLAAAARPRPAVVPIPPRTAPRRAWVPLAWAASLVLAVGAGWMGSLLYRGGAPEQTAGTVQTGEAARADAALEAVASAPAPDRRSRDQLAAEAGTRGPGEREPRALAGVSREEASDRAAARPQAAPPPPAVALGQVSAEAADSLGQRRERVAAVEARDSAVARGERVAAADVPAGQMRAANQAEPGAAGGITRSVAPPAAAKTVEQMAPAPTLGAGALPTAYPGDADVAWRTVTAAEAERVLGAPLYRVAGATSPEIAMAPRGASTLVRVRQNVDGSAVELVQWRETAVAADAAVPQSLEKAEEQKALPQPQAATRANPLAAAPATALPLRQNRTRDGSVYITVPNTAHPVLLKASAAGDLLELLPRVRQQR
jgi:hypothetical protein